MSDTHGMYHEGSRALQDRYDTRRLADRLEAVKVHDRFTPADREFVERLDMFFLATADAEGRPTCSYKGGDPGFVHVVDDRTLAFPNYDGNGMYLSMGNALVNPAVGLLFIDFERQRRMRVQQIWHWLYVRGAQSFDEMTTLSKDLRAASWGLP